jgi:hypothetical protein
MPLRLRPDFAWRNPLRALTHPEAALDEAAAR